MAGGLAATCGLGAIWGMVGAGVGIAAGFGTGLGVVAAGTVAPCPPDMPNHLRKLWNKVLVLRRYWCPSARVLPRQG